MTRPQISDVDLNVLAQVFYENRGDGVRLRSMTDKPSIVQGLQATFKALGYEVIETGERYAVELHRAPTMRDWT